VLGNAGGYDYTRQALAGCSHVCTVAAKAPPIFSSATVVVFLALGLDVQQSVLKRFLVKTCIGDAHFRYEERELARIGYPKLAEHRAEHKVMLDELRLIRERLDGMGQGTVQGEPGFLVLNFVLGVTIGHIFHSDMQYCVFARHASGNDAEEEEELGWPVS
jgi:hemerythrin